MQICILKFILVFLPIFCYARYNIQEITRRQLYQKKTLKNIFLKKANNYQFNNKTLKNSLENEEEENYNINKIKSPYFIRSLMEGSVWPLPQSISYGLKNRTIKQDGILLDYHGLHDSDCDILEFAAKTYSKKKKKKLILKK